MLPHGKVRKQMSEIAVEVKACLLFSVLFLKKVILSEGKSIWSKCEVETHDNKDSINVYMCFYMLGLSHVVVKLSIRFLFICMFFFVFLLCSRKLIISIKFK